MKSPKHSDLILKGSDFLQIGAETDPLCSFCELCPNLRDQSDGGYGLLIIPTDFFLPLWETLSLYDARSH